MEEEKLIGMFWNRSEDAIRCTSATYGTGLTALANRITGDPDDAKECVNDTYLAAWNSIPPTRPQSLFAYLMKICRNLCYDLLDRKTAAKRASNTLELSQELQQCIPDRLAEAQLESRLITHALNRFLGTLKPLDRRIFLRRYWYGDRIADIASALQVREEKIKTRLYRTREKLKAFLEQEGIDL